MIKPNKNNKKVFWVEKITLTDILLFLIQGCFADVRINYDKFQVYPSAAMFLGFLERSRLNKIFSPAELTLHKIDENGLALAYRPDKELNDCIEDFFVKYITQESRRFKDMLKSYISVNLKNKVTFITMVVAEINSKKENRYENNIIYLNRHPLNYLLCRFYRNREFLIRQSPTSMGNVTLYFRPCYYLACFLLCKLGGSKVKSNISDIKPAIWVEYYPGPFHSFWVDAIKSEDFDIVNYLDRIDTPVIKETTDKIETKGLKWIDAHFPSLIKISRLSLSDFLKILRNLFSVYFSRPVWFGIFKFEYFFLLAIYESVFLHYKVKILIQHQETSWRQEVQALAIERAGGIMVGYHWSVYPFYLLPTHFYPHHVYFVWGKTMSELIRKKNSACRYVLPSGMWSVPNGQKPERNNIFAESVSFIIAVFDDVVQYNLHQSPSSLSEFYLRILSIVKNNPRFGCIIKSKQPFYPLLSSLPSGKEILKEVETLKDQRRLEIFDFSEYPIAVAPYSNLSVSYTISSVSAIVAIVGNCPAINWDPFGMKKHPLYRYPGQKFIFSTLDELEGAILKASKGDKTIGDYSRWKKHINYFEDSSGVNRIVNFFESYMKENMSTGNPEHSLDFAVEKYLADNKVSEDFYEREDFWEDE